MEREREREREREHYTDQELSAVATVPRSKTSLILASCQGIGSGRNKMAYYIGKSVPTAILAYSNISGLLVFF